MSNDIKLPVAGGCPNCGNPDIPIPADWNDDTQIACPKCDYTAPHKQFFGTDNKAPDE
jgi:ribosomal protein S27AE